MKASNEIAELLEQWLQLTRAESAAIQSAAWPAVSRIQGQKAALQKSLKEAGTSSRPALDLLRAKAGRIVSLLTRNSEALAVQMRRAQDRQKVLDEVKRNLQRIQQSYARQHPPTAWHSYS